jgi:hypothetical protein
VTVRTASWVAWSLWALAVVLEVAAIPLWLANHPILLSRFGTAEDFAPTSSSCRPIRPDPSTQAWWENEAPTTRTARQTA